MSDLLVVRDLSKHYRIRTGGFFLRKHKSLRAVDGVSLAIKERACFGIVGETGSGKTTLSKLVLMLEKPTAGDIWFEGQRIADFDRRKVRWYRTRVGAVFQDAGNSLDPRMKVKDIVAEPLRAHAKRLSRKDVRALTRDALQKVGLGDVFLERYPHELSGGQKQRVAIARALILEPSLVILDEPVSALDVSIQAQILNLLADIQEAHGLTYLIISHDLAMLYHLTTQIAVMYMGKIVEMGDTEEVFREPLHPYTRALFAAIPQPVPGRKKETPALSGEIGDPLDPPPGCRFCPRCPVRQEGCSQQMPRLVEVRSNHAVACLACSDGQEIGGQADKN
ncbi:MAG: ABC transporter ATP-binding protein [Thermoleophilia bacterium]|nr:ABC transporter ATP-binding protein [Thermoleophilia bacterium]